MSCSSRARASADRDRQTYRHPSAHDYAHPELLVRGLIHSDGCRFLIFTEHLDLLGIEWRWSNDHTISIARRDSVARLDEFVGPKR